MAKFVAGDKWLALHEDDNGYYFVQSDDEALIVPLTAGDEVIFTVEYSSALERDVLLLPGGQIEPGEPGFAAGNRELQEEIGYRAGRLDFLAELHPWSKYLAVRSFIYLARDLTPSWLEGDEDYEIHVEKVPLREFEQLIAAGRLHDARVIAALYLAHRFLQGERQRRRSADK